MLDPILNNIYAIAGVAIAALGAARFYYGPEAWREVPWAPLRKTIIPVAHTIAKRRLGEEYYASYEVGREEHAVTLEKPVEDVVADLEDAGYVPEPLASYKTDWAGRSEAASYAIHHGDLPFPGAPSWLADRQTHATLFSSDVGGTIVTAHAEYNSWRPDLAEDHYRGVGMDVEAGIDRVRRDLGIATETETTDERTVGSAPESR